MERLDTDSSGIKFPLYGPLHLSNIRISQTPFLRLQQNMELIDAKRHFSTFFSDLTLLPFFPSLQLLTPPTYIPTYANSTAAIAAVAGTPCTNKIFLFAVAPP